MDFQVFKHAVAAQFERLAKNQLFRANVEKDDLWTTYLASFPAGTNPIFRERTEYDCSCCKQFVRTVGDVVGFDTNGKLVSVWDIVVDEPAFQIVADAMARLVKAAPVRDFFLHYEKSAGTDKNFEQLVDGQRTWNHFSVNIPKQFVEKNDEIATRLSVERSTKDVFLRSLQEITPESIQTVLDLIAQNSLYRGAENKFAVESFAALKRKFDAIPDAPGQDYAAAKEAFAWSNVKDAAGSVTNMRNSAIGKLLVDLSEGKDLEGAVGAFEAMVAPANYKRPTALITPAMIAKAKETLNELGLTSALERRYATLRDVGINNILFADRSTRKVMGGDVFDDLVATAATKPQNFDKVEEVPIAKFISDILPRAESIEVFIENRHSANFVSLIAPVDPTAGKLFKWDNHFSWSYNGELADSELRKSVQARGGRVDGVFRFSHQWNYDKRNASLMDLHVFMPGNRAEPTNGVHDNYGNDQRVGWNHRNHHASGGIQDVDYTAEAPAGYVPVENITFPVLNKMPEGNYVCKIHNWQSRSPTQGGFKAEIEFDGQVFQYECERPLKHKEWMTVAEVSLKNGVFTIKHNMPTEASSKTIWNVSTQKFHKVSTVMLSPNFWDEKEVGNKHFIFSIDGCRNDGSPRGFYNEFLKSELDVHRKTMEMVAGKLKLDDEQQQISGIGFSSTQRNHLVCKVKGSFTRTVKVVF